MCVMHADPGVGPRGGGPAPKHHPTQRQDAEHHRFVGGRGLGVRSLPGESHILAPYCWPVSFAGSLPAATEDQIELLASGPLLPADVPHWCFLPVSAATEDQIEPEELADLGPRDLSYWVASFFSDVKMLQQNASSLWRLKCGFCAACCVLLGDGLLLNASLCLEVGGAKGGPCL